MADAPRPGPETSDRLIVAELGRPHGIRGEILARLSGIGPEELVTLPGLVLRKADGSSRVVRVIRARPRKEGWILRIAGVEDRTAAEEHCGSVLLASRGDLPAPGPDEWYVNDLLGLTVVTDEGRQLGAVEEVLKLPANDVFVVRGERGEILIPAIEEVLLSVELEEGRIVVHLLPGLADEPEGG